MQLDASSITLSPFRAILLCGFVATFLSSLQIGLDGENYSTWANAITESNLQKLSSPTLPLRSPMGVPFYQWSAGPGIVLAPFDCVLNAIGIDDRRVMLITGAVSAAAFWICSAAALQELFGLRLALFGLVMAFTATPLGYYSRTVSSETLSLLPMGLLLWEASKLVKGKPLRWTSIACSTALLLMIRPYLGAYAWPVLLVGLWREIRFGTWKIPLTLTSFSIATALLQIGTVQWWMTGHWQQSPYSWGDAEFRSLDPRCPHLGKVLFDAFHGLVSVHPLVLFAITLLPIVSVVAAWKGRGTVAAIGCLASAAVAINVYLQGCWYYWWMSDLSFGMRGLVLTSVPGLLAWLALTQWMPRTGSLLGAACGVWSYLHLLQGPTYYMSWSSTWEGQLEQLLYTLSGWQALWLISILLIAVQAFHPRTLVDWVAVVFLAMIGTYLVDRALPKIAVVGLVAYFPLIFLYWRKRFLVFRVIEIATPLILVCGLSLFGRLAGEVIPKLAPAVGASIVFQEGDVRSCHEWLYLVQDFRPDFKLQEEELRQFLERSRGKDWIVFPPKRKVPEFTYEALEWMRKTPDMRYR